MGRVGGKERYWKKRYKEVREVKEESIGDRNG